MLASPPLRESHQLQAFLDFIVRETLHGRTDGLKEYLVGCRVVGRKPDYDPRHDGIVRVQATMLRKRIEKYYLENGHQDPVVIDIPRGAYVAYFRYREEQVPDEQVRAEFKPAEVVTIPAPASGPAPVRFAWRTPLLAFLLGAAVVATPGVFFWRTRPLPVTPYMATEAVASDFPPLWGPFFAPGAKNLIAYGVPLFSSGDGLYFRDVEVNVPEQTDNVARVKAFGNLFHITPVPMDDLYTGVGEVEATYRISNFFATHGVPVRVTNARTLGASEINGYNLVVVSSLRFQTLLQDLRLPADFVFVPSRPETIRNLKPLLGELKEYVFEAGAGIATSYALVSVWPGNTPDTRIMFIGGVHTWSTQAANHFMLDPKELRKLARQFDNDGQTGNRGPLSRAFQILLRVEGRGNQSHRVEYVTHHYLPLK